MIYRILDHEHRFQAQIQKKVITTIVLQVYSRNYKLNKIIPPTYNETIGKYHQSSCYENTLTLVN